MEIQFDTGAHTEPRVPAEDVSYNPWPGPGDSEGGGWDHPQRSG